MPERNNVLLCACWHEQRKRWWIDTVSVNDWPLPDGYIPICRIDNEDRHSMIEYAASLARKGYSIEALRELCGR